LYSVCAAANVAMPQAMALSVMGARALMTLEAMDESFRMIMLTGSARRA